MLTLFQDVSRGPVPGQPGPLESMCSWRKACLRARIRYGQTQPLYNFRIVDQSRRYNQNLKLGSHESESESHWPLLNIQLTI